MTIRSEPPYPIISYDAATDRWTVVQPFTVYEDEANFFVAVPDGYRTDLATIPRIAWTTFAAPYQLSVEAPIVHDLIYDYGGNLPANLSNRTFTRKEADHLFYVIMADRGVVQWRRTIAYLAVRWFGRGKF
jgi:hypothetical protein